MSKKRKNAGRAVLSVGVCLAAQFVATDEGHAQSSSLYGPPSMRRPLTLADSSWTLIKVEPPREIQKNDIITIIVDEKSQFLSEGEVQRRTQSNMDMRLQDWIGFDGFSIRPDPQSAGDPRVRGQVNSQLQTQAELETQDGLKFRIAVRVVDIRPNNTLVIEGHRQIQNNNTLWEQSIGGVVRREDVLPNNTVLSEDIAELVITKREAGHIRDATKRGWLLQWMDFYKPF